MWVTESTTNENGYCWLTYDRMLNRIEGYLGNQSIEYLLTTNLSFKATCEQTLGAKVCTFKPCMLALGWWICCDGGFRIHLKQLLCFSMCFSMCSQSRSHGRGLVLFLPACFSEAGTSHRSSFISVRHSFTSQTSVPFSSLSASSPMQFLVKDSLLDTLSVQLEIPRPVLCRILMSIDLLQT